MVKLVFWFYCAISLSLTETQPFLSFTKDCSDPNASSEFRLSKKIEKKSLLNGKVTISLHNGKSDSLRMGKCLKTVINPITLATIVTNFQDGIPFGLTKLKFVNDSFMEISLNKHGVMHGIQKTINYKRVVKKIQHSEVFTIRMILTNNREKIYNEIQFSFDF